VITLTVKSGYDPEWARRVAIGRLNDWYTDRALGDGPGRFEPGALLHYSVQERAATPVVPPQPSGGTRR
jgi:hypothetical protein